MCIAARGRENKPRLVIGRLELYQRQATNQRARYICASGAIFNEFRFVFCDENGQIYQN